MDLPMAKAFSIGSEAAASTSATKDYGVPGGKPARERKPGLAGTTRGNSRKACPTAGACCISGEARYDGAFLNGKPNGNGALTNASGTFNGTWSDGCFNDGKRRAAFGTAYNHVREAGFGARLAPALEETYENLFALALIVGAGAAALDAAPAAAAEHCRMEKQCRWVNFKKVCTYVKVCRER